MTIPTDTNRSDKYSTNGVTTNFEYPFKILDASHLEVYKIEDPTVLPDPLVLDTDYSVTGVGVVGGGNVVIDPALEEGFQILILRVMPLTQLTDIKNQGGFYPETVEDGFDYSMMIAQQQQEELDRSLKLSAVSEGAEEGYLADVAAAAIVATDASEAATASEEAAAASETAAAVSAATNNLPVPTGNANKMIVYKEDETGFDALYTIPRVLSAGTIISPKSDLSGLEGKPYVEIQEITEPTAPGANLLRLFAGDDDQLHTKSPSGKVSTMGGGGPVGSYMMWSLETEPTGYFECDGSAISRTVYPELFAVIGTYYGVGDGSTTFNIPDWRGRFPRIWAHGSANDPDRASRTDAGGGTTGDHVGTNQGYEIQSHRHSFHMDGRVGYSEPAGGGGGSYSNTGYTYYTGGNETRSINMNVMMMIRYEL